MNSIYTKEKRGGIVHFKKVEEVSLAGCNAGIIARHLKSILMTRDTEPFGWTIRMKDVVENLELKGNTIIIDMKPKSQTELLLFELTTVHGYSHSGWTPIMLELKEVLIDVDLKKWNREDFFLKDPQSKKIVRAFLYLRGSIKEGKLTGTWIYPPQSSTNGALLYPEVLAFFFEKAGFKKSLFHSTGHTHLTLF